MSLKLLTSILVSIFISIGSLKCQVIAEAEGAVVTSGYNEIKIPGDEGTFFDAGKYFNFDPQIVFRARAGYRLGKRHNIFLLYAPLKVKYDGTFNQSVNYYNTIFSPSVNTAITYVFNSYRLTYRYDFVNTEKLKLGAGLTGKIRDAYIEVTQNGKSAKKTNVGIVPLINVMAKYQFTSKIGVLLEGDWLASSNGRAFDLQLSIPVYLTENVGLKAGYRVLEGGADNDEVYNFTWINYYQAGVFYNIY